MANRILTTFEAARYCCVNPHTVRNWIVGGKLSAYTTPGGHRRIRKEDLDAFLDAHGMPIPQDFAEGGLRVLLAGATRKFDRLARRLKGSAGGLTVRSAPDGFALAWGLLTFRPHFVLLSWDVPGVEILEVLRRVRSSPETSGCRVVVAAPRVDADIVEAAQAAGAREVVGEPVDPETLLGILRALFPSALPKRGRS